MIKISRPNTATIVAVFLCLSVFMFSACATLSTETAGNESVAPQSNGRTENAPSAAFPSPTGKVTAEKSGVSTGAKLSQVAAPLKETDLVKNSVSLSANSRAIVSAPANPPPVIKHKPYTRDDLMDSSLVDYEKDPSKNKNSAEVENEKDIMEEALVLLDESHKYWAKGELDDALQMLDQAYALLLDTNGNPEIARQKDDLRLIISKRILAVYNSFPTAAKGKRGEIPLISNADVEKEIRSFQNYERDFFISSYYRSLIYRPKISAELKKAGLPDELSWLPLVESGFKINALSSARALGLWQFIPSTGYKYGLNRDDWVDERMDIEKSTRAAIAYFKDLHAMFGDWLTVLAGYNCGEGRVARTIASQQINYLDRFWDLYQKLPNETARYVPRFIATLLVVKDPAKYGFDFTAEKSKYDVSAYETVETTKSMRLQDIAAKLEVSEENLIILNAELRLKTTPNKPYKLKVPSGNADKLLQLAADIPNADIPRASSRTVKGVFIKYKVRRGETLGYIAEKYRTSVSSIRSANKLSNRGLYAGQKLNIPITKTSVSTTSVSSSATAKASVHKVKKGDTLAKLSDTYHVSVADLKKINNLKKDVLKIGQTIRLSQKEEKDSKKASIPQKGKAEAKTYKVKKGDNLARIAKEKGVALQKLLTLNKLTLKDDIYPGQEILVQ